MNSKWRRAMATGLVAVTVVSGTPAAMVKAETKEGVTMTVWAPKSFSSDADKRLEERIKSFADVDDRVAEVKVETFAGSEGQSKWSAAIESGNYPDVSFLVAAPYTNFSELGLLEDVSDVLADVEANVGALDPTMKEDMEDADGNIYALPLSVSATMLHYRTDYFEQAGIETPPTTWEELEEDCKKLQEAVPGVYPFGHAISASDDSESHNLWILRSFGGRLWDEDGNVAIDSPETLKAVEFIKNMYDAGYIPPTTIEWDSAGNNKSFLSGASAMVINLPTLYNEAINGDMKDTMGDVTSMAALPLGENETWKEPGRSVLAIFKGAPDVELSKDLLRYIYDEEWYSEYMDLNYPVNVPAYAKIQEEGIWNEGIGAQLVAQVANENRSFGYPCVDDSAVIRADASSLQNFMFSKMLIKVVTGQETPEDAIKGFAEELENLKEEMRLEEE